jgi:molecular chaperone DnaK
VEKLATVSQKMGQAMYAQAQQGATAQDTGQQARTQEEEGVVDAEIVDDERESRGGAA